MGAIQQAFNQALSAATQIAAPQIAIKKGMEQMEAKEMRESQKAQAKANQAFDVASEVFGEKGHSETERKLATKDLYEAQEANYRHNPTLENFALRAETYENYQEWVTDNKAENAARKAATAMAQQQQQYKDQSIAELRKTAAMAQSQHLGTREAK